MQQKMAQIKRLELTIKELKRQVLGGDVGIKMREDEINKMVATIKKREEDIIKMVEKQA
jgi:hypothetical protein